MAQISYPTPSATASSESGSRSAKRRRIQDSSSDALDLTINTGSAASSLTWTAEPYRVGIPPLQILPLENRALRSPSPLSARFKVLEPQIHQILRAREVLFDSDDVEVVYRVIPGDDQTDDDLTCYIPATWTNDGDAQKWWDAANDLRRLFITDSAFTRNLKVELISWQLTAARDISVVERNHPLVGLWRPSINPRIHEILNKYTKLKDGWLTVDVLRIGFSTEMASVTPVTISITVDWHLDRRDWYSAEREMRAMLTDKGFSEVEVSFERGDVYPTAGFELRLPPKSATGMHEIYQNDYPTKIHMGFEFGPARYFTIGEGGPGISGPTATVGGYLEIREKNGGDKAFKKYALTNYHCVRAAIEGYSLDKDAKGKPREAAIPEGSMLRDVDAVGLTPEWKARESMKYESPSRRKHNFSIQYHNKRIDSYEKYRLEAIKEAIDDDGRSLGRRIAEEQAKERKIQYFDNGFQNLGKLWMASGYLQRTKDNGRIDLALLELNPGRVGNNTVPDQSLWESKGFLPPDEACGKLLKRVGSCKDGSSMPNVFKFGSRTGATSGQFNSIKSDVKIKSDRYIRTTDHSTEYVFISDPKDPEGGKDFADHGDSGSFVFTYHGVWVGVIFGGTDKQNVNDKTLTYVIDAEEALAWISGQEGGAKYEVRLAES